MGVVGKSSRQGHQLRGRVTARGEILARWRVTDRVLQVVTGGLDHTDEAAIPDTGSESLKVQINPRTLEALLGASSS